VTQAVFIEYLSFLNRMIPEGPLCLVLDQYPTHVTTVSETHAASLGIRLIKVPKGGTGIWRPLDRRIDGAMKSKARPRWARLFARSDIPLAIKELAAQLALHCWKELTEGSILEAWDFDEMYPEEPTDDVDSDLDDAFFDVEHGHDDLEEIELNVVSDTSTHYWELISDKPRKDWAGVRLNADQPTSLHPSDRPATNQCPRS
jgi:hypothetical protein